MHKLALLMEDIARASVSAVVGLFMLGVAIVIGNHRSGHDYDRVENGNQ